MTGARLLFAACLAVASDAVAAELPPPDEPARAAPDPTDDAPSDAGDDGRPAGPPGAVSEPPAAPAARAEATATIVTVTAERPLSRDPAQAATRITGARLRESPRPSLLEAIAAESADVYVSSRGGLHGVAAGASGAIHVRGLGGSPNSQVLVVEDGVPDVQGIFGHPIPDAYVPFLLEEALIIKGGDSVLYGSNAMGGVLALRSRWRADDGFELVSDSSYGSYSTLRQTAAALGTSGDWQLAAGFHASTTEGHREGAGGNLMVTSTAVRYRPEGALALTVRNKLVRIEGADPGPVTHPTPEHEFRVWRDNASLELEWRGEALRLAVVPHLSMGWHRLYDGFRSTDYVGGARAELALDLHPTAELRVGAAAGEVWGTVEQGLSGERSPIEAETELAAYSQLTWRPVPGLLFVGGTRDVWSVRDGPVLLYKLGARWRFWDGLYLRTHLARNYRRPTLRERYLPFPTANPALRPEYSLNGDVGLGYQSERFEIEAAAYRTEARDLIKYFGLWPSAEVVNIGHVVVWGLEASARLRALGPVSLLVTGGWQEVGDLTRQNPEAKLDVAIDVEQPFGPHTIGGRLGSEWVHGLYMADYERQPIDDVLVMDLALRYRYSSGDPVYALEPYLLVRNLLDAEYAYVAGYPMPRLNLLAGLKVAI